MPGLIAVPMQPTVPGLVSVSLVCRNEMRWLPACLESLRIQTHARIEVLVVDNASADGTAEYLTGCCSDVLIIHNQANYGFSHAHNQGIRASRGEFVLVLNTDVILDPQFIERLVAAARRHLDAGAFSGKLLKMHSHAGDIVPPLIDHTGFFPLRGGSNWDRGAGRVDRAEWSRPLEIFGVSGAAGFYRRAALEDVREGAEYFDELFFGYAEDVDLAWRLQLRGWTAHYEPSAVGWHARTVASESPRTMRAPWINRQLTKNRHLVFFKNYPAIVFLRNAAPLSVWSLSEIAYLIVWERASLLGLWDLVRAMPSAIEHRRTAMSKRCASDRSVLAWFSWTEQLRSMDDLPKGLWSQRVRQLLTGLQRST